MIYISSSCISAKKIKDAVLALVQNGLYHIELSGGTDYYTGLQDDLIELKEKFDIHYIVHNYFPPPKQHFVLNLASLDDTIYYNSINHYIQAIELSKKIQSPCLGLHAGFLIDIHKDEIGKKIHYKPIFNKEKAINRFIEAYQILKDIAGDLDLYIENNVFSFSNKQTYKENPFFLTCSEEYLELKKYINFKLLLDVAHLKVSAFTHQLSFIEEFQKLSCVSDYWHLSGNDGKSDQNKALSADTLLQSALNQCSIENLNIVTLETYEELKLIHTDHNFISKCLER